MNFMGVGYADCRNDFGRDSRFAFSSLLSAQDA
jgi:hypothetical protein